MNVQVKSNIGQTSFDTDGHLTIFSEEELLENINNQNWDELIWNHSNEGQNAIFYKDFVGSIVLNVIVKDENEKTIKNFLNNKNFDFDEYVFTQKKFSEEKYENCEIDETVLEIKRISGPGSKKSTVKEVIENFMYEKNLKLCIKDFIKDGIEIFKSGKVYEWKHSKELNNFMFKSEISDNFECPMNQYEQQGYFHKENGNFTYSELKEMFDVGRNQNISFEAFFDTWNDKRFDDLEFTNLPN
jgi:hypothetical protein